MSAIAKIRAMLERYPTARIEASSNRITVLPADATGFPVTLEVGEEHTVYFDGWHEHFDNEDEAIACFGFGLSTRCRLKVTLRGDVPVRWQVESRQDAEWIPDSTTGVILFPFWKRKKIEYRANSLVGQGDDLTDGSSGEG